MLYDTLIRNALVIDGSNTPGYAADVVILDGRIARRWERAVAKLGLNDTWASEADEAP